jgi:hypothetical protein
MAEVVATYGQPDEARKAMVALERHGVDAAFIRVSDAPGMRTPKTEEAMREPDMAVTREIGRRSAVTSLGAAVVVGVIGLAIAMAISDADKTAMIMGGVGGFIVGGLLGMLYGGYSGMAVTDEWGESFEATGPVTLTVTVPDGEDVIDLRDRVEATHPQRVTVA